MQNLMRSVSFATQTDSIFLKCTPLEPLLSMFANNSDTASSSSEEDTVDLRPVDDTSEFGLFPTCTEFDLLSAIEEMTFLRQAGKAIENAILLKQNFLWKPLLSDGKYLRMASSSPKRNGLRSNALRRRIGLREQSCWPREDSRIEWTKLG
eukprot:Gregarina_sp_Poly_1__6203@NODE_328_length_9480_cov_62_396048_g50_i1_p3_GENE_NODE_328_length_9480_cov_62_396048_g50_i1NODE_328_length_9480_cov_62_396048_g50_i1_p3_ORF_typecomplete_len151_score18_54Pep1_7/PF17232_2/0_29Pep1_7/PF17232_2/1_4e04DUF5566/PF17721_1/58DUF5566/PF17721_1/2_8_NODE_328_length_9480_cov_62_396048_g50_i162026654